MDHNEPDRKLGALKAIIQAVMPEIYWDEKYKGSKTEFEQRLKDDNPVAVAIANKLTEDEIEEAFSWIEQSHASIEAEMAATPVTAYLSATQAERVRVMLVAMDGADTAYELALQTYDPPGKGHRIDTEDRVEIGESIFVDWMVDDAVARSGVMLERNENTTTEDRVNALPDPWRTHARVRLDELRTRLRATLGANEEK